MRRKTPFLKMPYFTTGESYKAQVDMERLRAVEDHLDVALKLTGGGVIKGWSIYQDTGDGPFQVTIEQGIGVIPVDAGTNQEYAANVPKASEESILIDNPGYIAPSKQEPEEDVHYMGIRSNGDITLGNPTVGKSRISVIYAKLNEVFISQFETLVSIINPDQNPVTVTIGSGSNEQTLLIDSYAAKWEAIETLIQIESDIGFEVIPRVSDLASYGAYRNVVPNTEYPIYQYTIEGPINYNNISNSFTVFVNGKSYYDEGFSVVGNTLIFDKPLEPEDLVTVRIEPKHALALAEIESDEERIIRIDNSIKMSVYEKIGDVLVSDILSQHFHDNVGNNPDKVLFTTESDFLSPYHTSDDYRLYKFQKPDASVYGFDFVDGTYNIQVYINNLLSIDPYQSFDISAFPEVQINFNYSLSASSDVKIKLVLKSDYTQVDGKIVINDYNASKDKIDVEIDATGIESGTLYPSLIPNLSHIGVNESPMKPCNSTVSTDPEYVHRCEHFVDWFSREYFPVYREKSNARGVTYLHSELDADDTSNRIIYACAPGGLLYTKRQYLVSDSPATFFDGWDLMTANGVDGSSYDSSELDSPLFVASINNTVESWQSPFVVSGKYIYRISWNEDVPTITEIINLSTDKGSNLLDTPDISSIIDACDGSGILNLIDGQTLYFLASDDKVYVYEYTQSGRKNTLLDITGTPLWEDAKNLDRSDFSGSPVLFVSTDAEVYINPLITMRLENNISSGTIQINEGFDQSTYVTSGDSVVFAEKDYSGEKTAIVASTSTYINVAPALTKNYNGKSNDLYNTVIIRDWIKIGESGDFTGDVKKVIKAFDKLFVLTSQGVYVGDYEGDIYAVKDLLTWTELATGYTGFNDFAAVGDISESSGYIIIAGDDGIKRTYYNGTSLSVSDSENSQYGAALNDMLKEAYHVKVDDTISKNENVVYVSGKYGVFMSPDFGITWRNTLQLLGEPEDKVNPVVFPQSTLKVSGKNADIGRIYVTKQHYVDPWGYGYGYGYGEPLDYFDVLSPEINAAAYGYGTDSFEEKFSGTYGYGYGFEMLNSVSGIDDSDWIYFEESSVTGYGYKPLRILGTGFDYNFGSYYVDVEESDGYEADLGQVFADQIIYSYKKTEPLALIDGIPQSSIYGVLDYTDYTFDPFRQSVYFASNIQDEIDEVTVASKYKVFKLVIPYDLSDFEEVSGALIHWQAPNGKDYNGRLSIKLNGLEFPPDLWSRVDNTFILPESWNRYHVTRLTATGVTLADTGSMTVADIGHYGHKGEEDELSVEETGFTYELDGVRNSNFLSILMTIQHKYTNATSEDFPSVTGMVSSVVDAQNPSVNPYITDATQTFVSGAYVGREIVFASGRKFTIVSNTSNTLFLLRPRRYNKYDALDSDGVARTEFDFGDTAEAGSISVYVNGSKVLSGWTNKMSVEGKIVGVVFDTAPADMYSGDVWVDLTYIDEDDFIDFTEIVTVGNPYEISTQSTSPFDSMKNIYLSMYRESDLPFDLDYSFVENDLITDSGSINNDPGKYAMALFYVYYDDNSKVFYSGTNDGVWKNEYLNNFFEKTNSMLLTTDATGNIPIPLSIRDVYIQFNKISEEWTVSWGGGFGSEDENNNLEKIKINSISICPGNENIVFAGTDWGIFRTINGGTTWTCIWDTITDSRTSKYPKIKDVVIDDKHPWVLNAMLSSGLYRSFNYGETWSIAISISDKWNSEKMMMAFAYQKDKSDARSAYYFAHNELTYKNENIVSPFGSPGRIDSDEGYWHGDINIEYEDLLRNGLDSINVSGLKNSEKNVSYTFMSSPSWGVYRSRDFGYAQDTYLYNGKNRNHIHADALASNAVNFEFANATKTRSMTKVAAFNEIVTGARMESSFTTDVGADSPDGGYSVFVDKENNKTYIMAERDTSIEKSLNDGDLVGSYVYLDNNTGQNYFKILEHYNRGSYWNHRMTYGGDFVGIERVEFVLDGAMESHEPPYGNGTIYNSTDGKFSIVRGNTWDSLEWFYIGKFGLTEGREAKLKIIDLTNCRVYAVREDGIFDNDGNTFLILDFKDLSDVPAFLASDESDLIGYAVGDSRQGEQYEIFESKLLPVTSAYYVDIAYKSKGNAADNRRQYACRIQGSEFSFGEFNDVYDLWVRLDHAELNNVVLTNKIFKTLDEENVQGKDGFYLRREDIDRKIHYSLTTKTDLSEFTGDSSHTMEEDGIWIGFDKGENHPFISPWILPEGLWTNDWPYFDYELFADFNENGDGTTSEQSYGYGYGEFGGALVPNYFDVTDNNNYRGTLLGYGIDYVGSLYGSGYGYGYGYEYMTSHLAPEQFVGKYVADPRTDKRYLILDVIIPDSTYDNIFDDFGYNESNVTDFDYKFMLRVEPYARAYCDQATLYTCGEISSISDDTITLSNTGGLLTDNSLQGSELTISNSGLSFLIISNTGNDITLNLSDLSSLMEVGDRVTINSGFSFPSATSLEVNYNESTDEESIFATSSEFCYESRDNGDTWKALIGGLQLKASTGKPIVIFDKVKSFGNVLYGVSSDTVNGGFFSCSLSGDSRTWVRIEDVDGETLASKKATDISVENGVIYVGTEDGVHKLLSGSSAWQDMVLPDANVTSLLAISGDTDLQPTGLSAVRGDLDRIWIGTGGHGFYMRAKATRDSEFVEDDWGRSEESGYFDEINASNWSISDVYKNADGEIAVKPLISSNSPNKDRFIYSREDFVPISSTGVSDPDVFDWSNNGEDLVYSRANAFVIVDPSNVGYLSRGVAAISTSNSSQKYHKLNNFTTNIEGLGLGAKTASKGLQGALDRTKLKASGHHRSKGVYEKPFSHMPDMSSITTIKPVMDGSGISAEGTIVLGTDRNGIWRTKTKVSGSSKAGLIMPTPSGTYDVSGNAFGYDFRPHKYTVVSLDATEPTPVQVGDKYVDTTGAWGGGAANDIIPCTGLDPVTWGTPIPATGLEDVYIQNRSDAQTYKYNAPSWNSISGFIYQPIIAHKNPVWFGVDGYDVFEQDGLLESQSSPGNRPWWHYAQLASWDPVMKEAYTNATFNFTYHFKRKKYWYYYVMEDYPTGENENHMYTDISNMDDFKDLIGGYLVISEDMDEVNGVLNSEKTNKDRRIFEITDIEHSVLLNPTRNTYLIQMSAGEATGANNNQNKPEGWLDRWGYEWDFRHLEDIDLTEDGVTAPYKEEGFDINRNSKVCILDFEPYEKISDGLPTSPGIKDSQGNDECGLFVRDLAIGDVASGKYPAMAACGINGLYVTEDISATTVTWTEWTDLSGDALSYDATSVIYESSTGDFYVGTWGNGVWESKFDGSADITETDSALAHKSVWCVYEDSSADIYIGTEHGGIYKLTGGSWVREAGITRSQIYMWKTTGVPTKQDTTTFDYTYSDKMLSYSFGGGVMFSNDGGASWDQTNGGLLNYYVQDVKISHERSDLINDYFTAYAATCGGGIFRTDDAFNSDATWYPLSQHGLPDTLNIAEVAIGLNYDDTVYVRAIINDLSIKDIPYEMRGMAHKNMDGLPNSKFYEDKIYSNNALIEKYSAISPYRNGIKKHVVYKGTVGSIVGGEFQTTWEVVYDKEPVSIDHAFSSAIYGLSCVPGTSELRFLCNYEFSYDNTFIFKTTHVSVNGSTVTEKDINIDFYSLGLYSFDSAWDDRPELFFSIDPYDTNKSYIFMPNRHIDKNSFSIFRTANDGDSWTDNLAPSGGDIESGFGSPIQIATKGNFPIYANFGNDVYVSIDSGNTWAATENGDIFSNPTVNVRGVVEYPVSEIADTTPNTIKSKDIVFDNLGNVFWHEGNLLDGQNPRSTVWTAKTIGGATVSPNELLDNCLAFSNTTDLFYISTKTAIREAASGTELYSGQVDYPLTVSEIDDNAMCFVSANRLYYTLDAANWSSVSDLEYNEIPFDGSLISKVLFRGDSSSGDVFICVNSNIGYAKITVTVTDIYETETLNNVVVTGSGNRFKIGDKISFSDTDTVKPYISTIKAIYSGGDSLDMLDTISVRIESAVYDDMNDRTIFSCNYESDNGVSNYTGTIFKIFTDPSYSSEYLEGVFADYAEVSGTSFKLYIEGDLSTTLTNVHGINYSTKYPYLRVGKLSDFLSLTFSGEISTSRETLPDSNGLWYSSTYGNGLRLISDATFGDSRWGCENVFSFDNGALTAFISSPSGKSRFIINDKWMPSSNVNWVTTSSAGVPIIATDNGIGVLSALGNPFFENHYLDNFESIHNVGNDVYNLFDSLGNFSIIDTGLIGSWDLNSITPTVHSISDVNKSFVDSNGITWIAAENGLYVFESGSNTVLFDGQTVRDIIEDVSGRIWVCLGLNGCSVAVSRNSMFNYDWISFTETNGLSGEVNAVAERYGLAYTSDGSPDTGTGAGGIDEPYVDLSWRNESSLYSNSVIMRSRTSGSHSLDGSTHSTRVKAKADTVTAVVLTLDSIDYNVWEVLLKEKSVFSLTDGELTGRYMILDATSSDDAREVIHNTSDDKVYIDRIVGEDPPSESDDNLMIAELVDGAYVMYSGDGTDVNFEFIDRMIVNDSTYYYYLYFHNTSNDIYNQIDFKQITIDTELRSSTSFDIFCAGDEGIYSFDGFNTRTFVLSSSLSRTVSNIYVDSINRMWLSASSRLIMYTPGNEQTFDKSFLFFDQETTPSGSLEIRNSIEGSDGFLYVATNLGLASFSIDELIHVSYVANDAGRLSGYVQNGEYVLSDWHITKEFENTESVFSLAEGTGYALSANDEGVYSSDNYGLTWAKVFDGTPSPKFFIPIYNEANDAIDSYSLIGRDYSYHINSELILFTLESLPYENDVDRVGSAGHLYLSEQTTGDSTILAGVVDNRIRENEVEIASLLMTDDSTATVTNIGAADGLAIQTVYSISEVPDVNALVIGCKDHIQYYDGASWRVVPFNNEQSHGFVVNGEPLVFSCVQGRHDASAIDLADGYVVYATNTPLYGISVDRSSYSEMGLSVGGYTDFAGNNIMVFRVGLSGGDFIMDLDEMASRYEVSSGLIDSGGSTELPYVDAPSFSSYSSQRIFKDYLTGHVGALLFVDEQKTLLIGGFDNTLYNIPFTSESNDVSDFDPLVKVGVSVVSGRRSIDRTAIPFTNESYQFITYSGEDESSVVNTGGLNYTGINYRNLRLRFNHFGGYDTTKFHTKIRPKNGWGVWFDDQEGYASFVNFGTNTDKINNEKVDYLDGSYDYISLNDASSVMQTNDGGMIWQQFTNSNHTYPSAAVSGFNKKDGTLYASAVYGAGQENVGVFEIDSTTKNWTQKTINNNVPIPIITLDNVDDEVYAGTSGLGVHVLDGGDFIPYESRFNTQYGLNVGKWYVTSIYEDASNKNRVLAATNGQGVLECTNAKDPITQTRWSFDINGLPSGNVSVVSAIDSNPAIVLAGINDDGLYIKNPTTGTYSKSTNGLPTTGSVKQIYIDGDVVNVYTSLEYEYAGGKELVILRSPISSPEKVLDDGTVYTTGYIVGNADIVYIGDGLFDSNIYKDVSSKLRNGIIYYYRIFEKDGTDYTELGTKSGNILSQSSSDIMTFNVEHSVSSFAGLDLVGRIVAFDQYGPTEQKYKIISHTDDSFTVEFDENNTINKGFFPYEYFVGVPFTVESTVAVSAVSINPVYIVFENSATGKGSIYLSVNNGENWTLIGFEGIFIFSEPSVNSISISAATSNSFGLQNRTIYAATEESVMVSADSGATWTIISTDELLWTGENNPNYNGLPNLYTSEQYEKLIKDEEDLNIIYTITSRGRFFRTINNGITWSLIGSHGDPVNDTDMVSYVTNYIYTGTNGSGLLRFDDPVRDFIEAEIEIDGKFTLFDIDYFEMGDVYFTDMNSIYAKTLVKNDDALDNREQVTFKVDDTTEYVSFRFRKSKTYVDPGSIHIGEIGSNPANNPFVLQNPLTESNSFIINKIGNVDTNEVFALTNMGAYTSTSDGDKWNKLYSAALPDEIYDISSSGDDEIVLSTENGLWLSENDRTDYRIIEAEGKKVKTIWEYNGNNGIKYLFRGGEDGLYITLENSRSLVVYTGDKKQNKISWGDLFNPNDGGWSNSTIETIKIPVLKPIRPSADPTEYDDWDYCLVARTGPFVDYDSALVASRKSKVFKPNQQVLYPGSTEGTYSNPDHSAVFTHNDYSNPGYHEEIRDVDLYGGIGGQMPSGRVFMRDGSIIIGNIKNRRGNPPSSSVTSYYSENNILYDTGPTTKSPIIDEVQPNLDQEIRDANNLPYNIAMDITYYDGTITDSPLKGKVRGPELLANMYYVYRAYPYIYLPDPMVVGIGDGPYEKFPKYRPAGGDIPDDYSFILEISKFPGSTVILSGISTGSANWIVGTDNGIFYSLSSGMDVNKADIIGTVPALIYTSAGVAISAVVLQSGEVQILTSQKDRDAGIEIGQLWNSVIGIQQLFYKADIKRIYNFTEYNSKIYASTNVGIISGNLDGTNWKVIGSVGNIESMSGGRVLGQEFRVH